MTHKSSFAIRSARDFYHEIVVPQYKDFLTKNSSSRHALLAIIVAYHMFEWANKNQKFDRKSFSSNYPNEAHLADFFEVARNITNGTKHFKSKVTTRTQRGFSSAFSSSFARPLNVEFPDGTMKSADELLKQMIEFWARQEAAGAF